MTLLGTKETNPHLGLAGRFLQLVLEARRREASGLVLGAAERGVSVKDIYLHVFQPVQREIGRLWQENQVSVAQEHLATAVTQLVMSQLYPRIFGGERRNLRLVATCIGGELHEIGVRMVADFFEMDGWDTFYLGANTPADALVDEVVSVDAHLVAISVTMATHLDTAGELVQRVRREPGCAGIKVMVGGIAFASRPDLWRQIDADGTAPDAEAAVALGSRLVGAGS
jgi:methylmalonyl-CoA mutase cobalamin-binding domain/chain